MKLQIWILGPMMLCCASAALAASSADEGPTESFAKCIVARAPDAAKRGLIEFWAPSKYVSDIGPPVVRACASGGVGIGYSPDFRHALAFEWLRRNEELLAPISFDAVPELSHDAIEGDVLRRVPAGQSAEDSKAQHEAVRNQQRALSEIGECVVRGHPNEVRQLLRHRADPGVTTAVVPFLGECVPAKAKLHLEPDYLTGLLALTYVRLALMAQGVAAQ